MDKYIVIYSFSGLLYDNENEQTPFTYNNTDESHKHNVEQKKPEGKKVKTLWFYAHEVTGVCFLFFGFF